MTQHVYDEVIDMTDSSVFHAGYYDDEDKVVYLVFNNGTTVSRYVHPHNTIDTIRRVKSWGSWWNYNLKQAESGPEVNSGDEFIHRSQVVGQEADDEPTHLDSWGVFTSHLRDHSGIEITSHAGVYVYPEELRAALTAAIDSLLTAQSEPADDEPMKVGPFTTAAQNSEGTFIGVGFFDVPEDVRTTVLTAANGLADFVRTEVGEISNVVEQFDVQKVRELFRRFV